MTNDPLQEIDVAKRYVEFTLAPNQLLGNTDLIFNVYREKGKYTKFGELRVSRGGVGWYARGKKRPTKHLTWEQFHRRMEDSD